MSSQIVIGKPYIKKEDNSIKLCANVKRFETEFELYYEVENKYEKYLTWEIADAFVLGILEYAMHLNMDIVCENPISERLYYMLSNYYIPTVSKNLSFFHHINIKAPISNIQIKNESAVGTGFSGGVDSYYSVVKHLNCQYPHYKLTHLVITNVGSFRYDGGEISKKIFEETIAFLRPAAEKLKLPLITINTNYMEFYEKYTEPVNNCGTLKNCSCIYALKKLFSVYYYSSGVPFEKFEFHKKDPSFYDLFTLSCISNVNLEFYSCGSEVNRIEKVDFISQYEVPRDYLSVCLNTHNCGKCRKCIRTLSELYVLNKLELYKNVFDVEKFRKKMPVLLAKNFANKMESVDGFNKEIIEMAKRNGIKIPIRTYVYATILKPIYFIMDIVKKNKNIRRIYYKLNIDVLLHGKKALLYRNYYITKEEYNDNK